MAGSVIGAQLFTLREFVKTPKELADTLRKLREIGYEAIQFSGAGPIEWTELAKILKGEGMTCAATHVGFESLRDNLEKVAEDHHTVGCEYAAIGSMPYEYRSEEGFRKFAKDATAVADLMKKKGLTFGYHNHDFELEKFDGKTPGIDTLIAESGKNVTMEIDTYWIQHGGGNPVTYINKCAGRIPLLHLKDMGMVKGQKCMMEVGEGNLEWPAILAAAKKAGVVWYLVEQDHCQRDPFESLAISLRNLNALGLK